MNSLQQQPLHRGPHHESEPPIDEFDEDVIDLRHYWRVLMRFKKGIIGLGLVFAVVTYLFLMGEEDIYESSVTLRIESNKATVASIDEILGLESQSREYFNTQFELLKSRSLAERVIQVMNLKDMQGFEPKENRFSPGNLMPSLPAFLKPDPGVNSQQLNDEERELSRLVGVFNSNLTVSPVRNTDLVKVTYEAGNPKLAAAVANTIASEFIKRDLDQRMESSQQTVAIMQENQSGVEADVRAAEAELQKFIEDEDIVSLEGASATDLDEQRLNELTSQVNNAELRFSQLDNALALIRELEDPTVEQLLGIPAIQNNPAIAEVRSALLKAEQEIRSLSNDFGPVHRKMVNAVAQRDELLEERDKRLQQALNSLASDHRAAQEDLRAARNILVGAEEEFREASRLSTELRAKQRQVEAARRILEVTTNSIQESNLADDLKSASAIIVDPAVAAVNPSKPRRKLITAIAMMAGLMLGTGFAFLRDMLDNTIHSPADIEERLNATTLGLIPFADAAKKIKKDKHAYLGVMEDNHSSFSESFRTIRTSLMLSSLDKPYKVIEVTSSVPNEGKTTVSINLASVLGQMNRVLLIDADMRRPALAKSLGLDPRAPGLSNLMAGTAEGKDCIQYYKKGGFAVMPGGLVVSNPLELLSSPKFRQLLDKLSESFDQIILDTPPTQTVSDSLVMASMADASVYVVKADTTPINVIKSGLSRMYYANGNVVGVILNQVDIKKQSSYYYYGGYYDTYGYSKSEIDEKQKGAEV